MISAPDMTQNAYSFLPARWLTRFEYATRRYVADAHWAVLLIHNPEDEIIPFAQGRSVFDAAPPPKAYLELRGNHDTGFLESGSAYTAIDEVLNGTGRFRGEQERYRGPFSPGNTFVVQST